MAANRTAADHLAVDPAAVDPTAATMSWVESFIMRPHPDLNRDGPVCPFVGPAREHGTFELRTWTVGPEPDVARIVDVVLDCVREFRSIRWAGRNRILHALLVQFPDLSEADAPLLDHAQPLIKDQLVEQDIMLAQFHRHCPEQAARNPDMLAFQSPVPMIAVRNLAFHDILFLHEKPHWFRHYARRYGKRYRSPAALDPYFVETYRAAVAAHGDPLADTVDEGANELSTVRLR